MRKTMTREITQTKCKVAKMVIEKGAPKAVELPDEILLGNVNIQKAQKEIQKKYEEPVNVIEVHPDTKVYEMNVIDYMKHATIREESPEREEK